MTNRSKLAVVVLTFVLSGILAMPALATPREGRRDDPIVRIIKRLLQKFAIAPTEDIAVPKP
jgi:hypothetical protein